MAEKIQTLHTQEGKTNKRIDVDKYNFIRKHLIAILQENDCTHPELMELLYQKVKDDFVGGVQ